METKLTDKQIRKQIRRNTPRAQRPSDPRMLTEVPVIPRKIARAHNRSLDKAIERAARPQTLEDWQRIVLAEGKRATRAAKRKSKD